MMDSMSASVKLRDPQFDASTFLAAVDSVSKIVAAYRKPLFNNVADVSKQTVAFVVIAWTNIQVFLVEFSKTRELGVLFYGCDESVGARDLDDTVFHVVANRLDRRTAITDHDAFNRRSINEGDPAEAATSVQSARAAFMPELGIVKDQRAHKTLRCVRALCEESLAKSSCSVDMLDKVEVFGSATSVPSVQQIIEECFQKPVSRSFVADNEFSPSPIFCKPEKLTNGSIQLAPDNVAPSAMDQTRSGILTSDLFSGLKTQGKPLSNCRSARTAQTDHSSTNTPIQLSTSRTAPEDRESTNAKSQTVFFEDLGVYITVRPFQSQPSNPAAKPSSSEDEAPTGIEEGQYGGFTLGEKATVYHKLKQRKRGTVNWLKCVPDSFFQNFNPAKKPQLKKEEKKRKNPYEHTLGPPPDREEVRKVIERVMGPYLEARRKTAPEFDHYSNLEPVQDCLRYTLHTATDNRTGETVFMKRANDNETSIKRMQYEIEILKQAQGPNIVRLREAFVHRALPYLIMDMPEIHMADVLDEVDSFTEAERKGYLILVLKSLKRLHDLDISHGSIIPDNIYYEHGVGVTLSDFRNATKNGDTVRTSYMEIEATYRAPEHNGICAIMKKESDLWSIGMLCQDLVMGQPHWMKQLPEGSVYAAQRTWCCYEELEYITTFAELSEEEYDFIRSFLHRQWEKRMSVDEALNHPWLTQGTPATPVEKLHKVTGHRRAAETKRTREAEEEERLRKRRTPFD